MNQPLIHRFFWDTGQRGWEAAIEGVGGITEYPPKTPGKYSGKR
jgi:hypothetical protein